MLEWIGLRSRRLDLQEERWSALRPEAFIPLSTEYEITGRLDYGLRELTAVPGSGESLRFAQRLGIGRHTPCLVVVTDIGELTAHVLPFAGRSSDEVYRHVRAWIDDYYEINRAAIEHWTAVEQKIRELSSALSRSLRDVRAWPKSQRHDWQVLRQVATLASTPPTDLAGLDMALRDHVLPVNVQNALSTLRWRLEDIDRQLELRRQLSATCEALAEETEPQKIRKVIKTISVDAVTPSTRAVVAEAITMLGFERKSWSDRWREDNASRFSRRKFCTARGAWRPIFEAARADGESVGDHKRRDYAAFRVALDVRLVGARQRASPRRCWPR